MRVVGTRTMKKRQRRKQTVNCLEKAVKGGAHVPPCRGNSPSLSHPGLLALVLQSGHPSIRALYLFRTRTCTVTAGQVTSVAWVSMLPFIKCVCPKQQSSQVALVVKNPPANAGDREMSVLSQVGKIPWKRAWKPTPVFLPGESPWTEEPGGLQSAGCEELDTTE